jgi:hypothetical protein
LSFSTLEFKLKVYQVRKRTQPGVFPGKTITGYGSGETAHAAASRLASGNFLSNAPIE